MTSPQTDAFLIEGGNYSYAGLANHARRLERERDEALEALLELLKWVEQSTDTRRCPVSLLRAMNRARAILAKAKP